jgi:hypothetical protein
MNTTELRAWVVKHDVEKRTIDGFWEYINTFEQEENETYFDADVDKSKLELNLNRIGLFIDAWSEDAYTQYGFDYVISYLPVVYNEEVLGHYKLFFKLDGDTFDDTFSIL